MVVYTIPLKLYANHANGNTNNTIHTTYNFIDNDAPFLKGKLSKFLALKMNHIDNDASKANNRWLSYL